jgi:predicted secreted hydrolase
MEQGVPIIKACKFNRPVKGGIEGVVMKKNFSMDRRQSKRMIMRSFSILTASVMLGLSGPALMAETQVQGTKNTLPNRGVPLFVDIEKDLLPKADAALDSYYVNCCFEADGKQLGFEWHEMIYRLPQGSFTSTEFLLMNGSDDHFFPNTLSEPFTQNNSIPDGQLSVFSSIGELKGDQKGMTLRLQSDKGNVNVSLRPRKEVLYNGTTGLLNLAGSKSYEYAYTNMDVEGTVTIDGKDYKVKNATAWFDRQWSGAPEAVSGDDPTKMMSSSWLWLGMPLNGDLSAAISLWDLYADGGRNACATILNKNGTQINVPANISYDGIWTSRSSGNKYPRKIHVAIPDEKIDFTLESLITNPDFVHSDGKGAPGCQVLCKAEGTCQGKAFSRNVIVEMIGDLCGK